MQRINKSTIDKLPISKKQFYAFKSEKYFVGRGKEKKNTNRQQTY